MLSNHTPEQIRKDLERYHCPLIFGYLLIFTGIALIAARLIVYLAIDSSVHDLIYWIMFAVGILVEILGICLVGYARGKRNAILRRCHSPVLCPTVVVGPNQQRYVLPPGAPPGYLTTANLPPAYNTQYGFIPSAPQGQSNPGFGDLPPYSEVIMSKDPRNPQAPAVNPQPSWN